jgi:hypothetical protein
MDRDYRLARNGIDEIFKSITELDVSGPTKAQIIHLVYGAANYIYQGMASVDEKTQRINHQGMVYADKKNHRVSAEALAGVFEAIAQLPVENPMKEQVRDLASNVADYTWQAVHACLCQVSRVKRLELSAKLEEGLTEHRLKAHEIDPTGRYAGILPLSESA